VFTQAASWFLIALLTFSVGAKEIALQFCLCEHTFFLDDAPCLKTQLKSCCNQCGEEDAPEIPLDDCAVQLDFEIPDYVWSDDGQALTSPAVPLLCESFHSKDLFLPERTQQVVNFPTRGPPPPGLPLFKRHSVFRL